MNRTWWAAVGLAVAVLAACAAPDEPGGRDGEGLGKIAPLVTATPTSAPEHRLDRFTPPKGECGVTLICGLGAGPDGPMTP